MALSEKLIVGNDAVLSQNFDDYHIPRISDVPPIEVEIVSRREIAPAGAGEVALIAGVPAIANAVRDATGSRITTLPIEFDAAWVNLRLNGHGWRN